VATDGSFAADGAGDAGGAGDARVLVDAALGADAQCSNDAGTADLCVGWAPFPNPTSQKIDGYGDEFCNVPTTVYECQNAAFIYGQSLQACGAKVQMAWSLNSLHAFLRVTDKTPSYDEGGTGGNFWNTDSVEIRIRGTAPSGWVDWPNGGHELLIGLWGGTPTIPHGTYWGEPGKDLANGVELAAVRTADGYDIELRVAWKDIGVTSNFVLANQIIPVAIGLNDRIDPGTLARVFFVNRTAPSDGGCGSGPPNPTCDDRTWCQPRMLP
jgi:hypothetical protein